MEDMKKIVRFVTIKEKEFVDDNGKKMTYKRLAVSFGNEQFNQEFEFKISKEQEMLLSMLSQVCK